jgi:hypothetical protein
VNANPHAHRPVAERVLGLASGGDGMAGAREATKNESPCVSTSTSPCREKASRKSRR